MNPVPTTYSPLLWDIPDDQRPQSLHCEHRQPFPEGDRPAKAGVRGVHVGKALPCRKVILVEERHRLGSPLTLEKKGSRLPAAAPEIEIRQATLTGRTDCLPHKQAGRHEPVVFPQARSIEVVDRLLTGDEHNSSDIAAIMPGHQDLCLL